MVSLRGISTLPIYDVNNVLSVTQVADAAKNAVISRDAPIASTWLLTGITGSDFIDQNSNGRIDDTDLGYWIKFNYGRLNTSAGVPYYYQWANPSVIDPTGTVRSSSSGTRENYYLNSIETRSHVAIFLKDLRLDNFGGQTPTLCLKEIALLTRDSYKKLNTVYGLPNDSGTISSWWNTNTFFPISGTTLAGNFLKEQAIKRVRLNQGYDLCPNTPNSTSPTKAKLTLKSISIFGRNGMALMPDYKFEYGHNSSFTSNYFNNPSYHQDKWDGWGMYNSAGTSDYRNHKTSYIEADGSAWSLSRIITPMGSSIDVTYERDGYSSVSGNSVSVTNTKTSGFRPGEKVNITRSATATCTVSQTCVDQSGVEYTCYGPQTFSVDNFSSFGTVLASGQIIPDVPIPNYSNMTYTCPDGSISNVDDSGVNYFQSIRDKKGGNIRVSSIEIKDGSNSTKTKYLYTLPDGSSSGVVSQEPGYQNVSSTDYGEIPNYPFTPVLYSRVSVLSGRLSNDFDYHTKTVYDFETPSLSMITQNTDQIQNSPSIPAAKVLSVKRSIFDRTSKIGTLKKVSVYDINETLAKETTFNYTEQVQNSQNIPDQGYYSSSTLMHERFYDDISWYKQWIIKMTRTTEVKVPYVLSSITTNVDGFTKTTVNQKRDFVSGQIVDKTDRTSMGLQTRTIVKPAYAFYPSMGSKAVNVNNKNMLLQDAATYTYQIDQSGNTLGLLGASAQTWTNDWQNYRYLLGSAYQNETGALGVWRRSKSYSYVGNYSDLRKDGGLNFGASKEYDFSISNNPGWKQINQLVRYDHFSYPIEVADVNNIVSSAKKDITLSQLYAKSNNAGYHEFAYAGAEDWNSSNLPFLGGEVAKGDGSPVSKTSNGTETHSGQLAGRVENGLKTFIYKTSGLKANRTYSASVWTNSLSGAIYYYVNGLTNEQLVYPTNVKKVGNWYQINVDIPTGTTSIEVGVKSTSGQVSFDDFRFYPKDALTVSYVYDPITGALIYQLNNQNLFTRYDYSDNGLVVKVYQESFTNGVTLVSENKSNFKRFKTN